MVSLFWVGETCISHLCRCKYPDILVGSILEVHLNLMPLQVYIYSSWGRDVLASTNSLSNIVISYVNSSTKSS